MLKNNNKHRSFKKGFTLLELLVVISIIGVLAGISLFGLKGAREAARDGRRKADLETIRSALELYKADCDRYPPSPLPVGNQLTGSTCTPANTNVYLEKVPKDPLPDDRFYSYTPTGTPPTSYTLCAALEGETAADSICSGGCGGTCSYGVRNP